MTGGRCDDNIIKLFTTLHYCLSSSVILSTRSWKVRRQDNRLLWVKWQLSVVFNPIWYLSWLVTVVARWITNTLGADKNWTFRLREFLSPRCINFKNLCSHNQEEALRIPKHPQLAKFAWFDAKLWHFKKNNVLTSLLHIFNQNYFEKVLFSLNCHNLAQNHPNFTC